MGGPTKDTAMDTSFKSTMNGDFEKTPKLSTKQFSLIDKNQQFCLVGRAGPNLCTRAHTVCLQIVGCFATENERNLYIDDVSASGGFNMMTEKAEMNKFFYAGSSTLSPEDQLHKVNTILNNTKKEWEDVQTEDKAKIDQLRGDEPDVEKIKGYDNIIAENAHKDRHTNFVDLLRWLDNKEEEDDPIY